MKLRSVFMHSAGNPAGFFRMLKLLPKFIRLIFRLFFDPRVALFPKILLIATAIYALSPLDFLPELLFPLLGYTDDVLLLILAVKYLFKSSPQPVLEEHVAAIEKGRTVNR